MIDLTNAVFEYYGEALYPYKVEIDYEIIVRLSPVVSNDFICMLFTDRTIEYYYEGTCVTSDIKFKGNFEENKGMCDIYADPMPPAAFRVMEQMYKGQDRRNWYEFNNK